MLSFVGSSWTVHPDKSGLWSLSVFSAKSGGYDPKDLGAKTRQEPVPLGFVIDNSMLMLTHQETPDKVGGKSAR